MYIDGSNKMKCNTGHDNCLACINSRGSIIKVVTACVDVKK